MTDADDIMSAGAVDTVRTPAVPGAVLCCPVILTGILDPCDQRMSFSSVVGICNKTGVDRYGIGAVPFLVRYLFSADFRSQLVGNFLIGVPVLLACQILAHFVVFNVQPMPVGTVVGAVVIPFFIWMMALQKRGWE